VSNVPLRNRIAVGLLAAVLLAACGTRLPDSAFETQGRTEESSSSDDGGDTGGDAEATDGAVTSTDGGTAGATTTGGATGGATGGTTTGGAPGGASGPNQASDTGITATTITIGNITAENGVLGDAFAPAVRGLRAWVQAINAKGGMNGRQVILKTCDDREDRTRTLACARRLVEQDKVFALIATNTRAMGGAAEYLNQQGIPVVGMPITASFYRYPHFFGLYPQPMSYKRDGSVGNNGQIMGSTGFYRWFKEELGVQKAAVFLYDIPESKQAGDSFAKGLQLEGFSVQSFTVSFAAPSFDQAVAAMQSQGTEIIFDSMDDGANRKLCDAMARRQFSVKAKVSTIVAMGDTVGERYNDTCRNSVYIGGNSIPYTTTSNPVVKEFRDAYARYQPGQPVHQWALEAWAAGNLLRDALQPMGPAPTRKGFEDFLRAMKKYTGGGVFLPGMEYSPSDFSAPTEESCFTMARWLDDEGGWTRASATDQVCIPDATVYASPALEQGN